MRSRQGLSENVSKIVTARNKFDAQITTKNTFTNIMIVYFKEHECVEETNQVLEKEYKARPI